MLPRLKRKNESTTQREPLLTLWKRWNRQRFEWKMALRIATSPSERWLKKDAEWCPDLSSDIKPTERLEDRKRDGKMTSMISSNKLISVTDVKIKTKIPSKKTRR